MHYIIIGLGNPGEQYTHTRHNIGRDIVAHFHNEHTFPDWHYDKKKHALHSTASIADNEVTLILPETFMNNSGIAVRAFFDALHIDTEHIIIVHDDLDLPLGRLRIGYNRGAGGHNGIKSIVQHLKTKAFTRLRFGIIPTYNNEPRKPRGEQAVLNFVLKQFNYMRINGINLVQDADELVNLYLKIAKKFK